MKEYGVTVYRKNGKWFYQVLDAETWNGVVLTESQYQKLIENHNLNVFTIREATK